MVTRSCGIFILNFVNSLKNLYGHFWQTPEGFYKYYLKLDGYYFCRWKKCTVAVIQIRNKRTAKVLPLFEILNDKDYLKELHPADACILGILANNERNGIIDHNYVGWRQMNRSKEYKCIIKSEPILEVSRKYTNQDADEIIVLHSKFSNKEIEISATELCKNQALLYALDSSQTISIGYDASESLIRNNSAKAST